jgi:hypothetical protein
VLLDIAQPTSNTALQTASVATIASATTIGPTTPLVAISGTNTITTVTMPSGFTSGCFDSLATGAWSTATGGNIYAAMTRWRTPSIGGVTSDRHGM